VSNWLLFTTRRLLRLFFVIPMQTRSYGSKKNTEMQEPGVMSAPVFLSFLKPSKLRVGSDPMNSSVFPARPLPHPLSARRKSTKKSKPKSSASCSRSDHCIVVKSLFHLIIKYMTSSRPSLNHNSYRFYHRNSPEAE
jgi:hypothetical protein